MIEFKFVSFLDEFIKGKTKAINYWGNTIKFVMYIEKGKIRGENLIK